MYEQCQSTHNNLQCEYVIDHEEHHMYYDLPNKLYYTWGSDGDHTYKVEDINIDEMDLVMYYVNNKLDRPGMSFYRSENRVFTISTMTELGDR
jgi:hypothetical protein